jgi:hypothetical protein
MKKVTLASLVLTVLLARIQPLYAQVQDQWATTGTMQDGRELSAQVLMKTGSVLSTGGVDHNNDILASAEVYSPASGTWKLNGSMAEARESRARHHRFRYGRVVRSDHRTLAPAGTLSVARFGHTATLLSSGKFWWLAAAWTASAAPRRRSANSTIQRQYLVNDGQSQHRSRLAHRRAAENGKSVADRRLHR